MVGELCLRAVQPVGPVFLDLTPVVQEFKKKFHSVPRIHGGSDQGFVQDLKSTVMEVTEIILAKVSRVCQLSSHSRGVLLRL
jgi:hypothetical protein